VTQFNTPELRLLIDDMFDTMEHANGAGLAAPQIGVDLQVVIFGFDRNPRYPDAPTVPKTVLINPSWSRCPTRWKMDGKGASRCRACAAWCRATRG
jgi:peptide deformylase